MNKTRFTKSIVLIVMLAISLVVVVACSTKPMDKKEHTSLDWKIPNDIKTPKVINTKTLQKAFDEFSWESFIALNWPANKNGTPDKKKIIGQKDAKTVWEHWLHTTDIFLPDGGMPVAWGGTINTADYCTNSPKTPDKIKSLGRGEKISDFLVLATEPMDTGPLIDLNGQYVQYEINLNKNMYDYIKDNELYNVEGQQQFAAENNVVNFDSGTNATADFPGKVGAIVVKAAWKVLGKNDDPSRFHTVNALIWSNPAEKGDGSCRVENVGLVGFHIAHKTESAPQWAWSTFEQVDNAPETSELPCDDTYNFHNCSCSDCPVNKMAEQPWNPDKSGQTPTQVTRVVPITKETREMNAYYQAQLRQVNPDTPWQYYMLISTQWPTKPGDPVSFQNPDPKGSPAPMVLSNTTLETFTQGVVPQIGTSCTDCHFSATNSEGQWTDFTYTLGMASKKTKKGEQ